TFHHQDGTVTAGEKGTTGVLPTPPGTQDNISCAFYIPNMLPMTPGASLMINIHHTNKKRQIKVPGGKMEMMQWRVGRAETEEVLVIMPFRGLFINKGNIRVWFTTDERRIPVRMKAKVIIGAIVADLVAGFSTVGPPH